MPKGLFVRPIEANKIRGESHAVPSERPIVTVPATIEHHLEARFRCGPSWFRYAFPSMCPRDSYAKHCRESSHGELTDGGEYSDRDVSPSNGAARSSSLIVDHLFLHNLPELQKEADELFVSMQSGMAMTFEESPSNPLSTFLL